MDNRVVTPDSEVKSVSQETTFESDITDYGVLEATLMHLTESVGFRLRQASLRGRTVTLKVRYHDFRTITRSRTMDTSTNHTDRLWTVVRTLGESVLGKRSFSVRLVGVGVSGFRDGESGQASLFDMDDAEVQENSIDSLTDRVRNRFGPGLMIRGKSLDRK